MTDAPKLTRRDVLGGVAAAGAGALIGPAAARAAAVRSAAARPDAGRPAGARPAGAAVTDRPGAVFSMPVGALDGSSAVLSPAGGFALAGVQWSAPRTARIELRSRARDGRWGPWALASVQGHDGDHQDHSSGRFGEPLWCGRADQLQLRSSGPVTGVRVHFVAARVPLAAAAPGPLAAVASLPLLAPALPAGAGQPPIIARSAWAHGRARPGAGPFYGEVELAFVHHTDNPNGYSAAEVPAMLLAMYDYHRFVRGYYDIAYNFVIDAFGRTWEAREGGIDEPVLGAHAGAYNSVSTGIAVLGTFMSSVPSAATIGALQRLLAWKLSLHGVPARGKVTVEVNPADAFYTPFAPGQHVALPRIAGHRDGDSTDCPGDAFYRRLPSIRSRVAALAGAPALLRLIAPITRPVASGSPVTVGGRLTRLHGPGIAGTPIEIQTVGAGGTSRTVATAVTDAHGDWSASLSLRRGALVRALHRPAPAAVSTVAAIEFAPAIGMTLVSSSPPRVSGTVAPGRASVSLDVYRLQGGHRRLETSRRVSVRGGAFASKLALGSHPTGSFVVVARTAAGGGLAAGASAPLTVTV